MIGRLAPAQRRLQAGDLVERVGQPLALGDDEDRVVPADRGHGQDRDAGADGLLHEAGAPAERGDVALAPAAHGVHLTARPDDDVLALRQRRAHALPVGRDHADGTEVVTEPGRGHEDVVRGAVQVPLPLEVHVPRIDQRPRVHGQRTTGVHADDQTGLVGDPLPPVDLDPEVELVQQVVEGLLQLQQRLVRRVRLHGRPDPPVDQPLDDVLVLRGVAVVPGRRRCGRRRRGLLGRSRRGLLGRSRRGLLGRSSSWPSWPESSWPSLASACLLGCRPLGRCARGGGLLRRRLPGCRPSWLPSSWLPASWRRSSWLRACWRRSGRCRPRCLPRPTD